MQLHLMANLDLVSSILGHFRNKPGRHDCNVRLWLQKTQSPQCYTGFTLKAALSAGRSAHWQQLVCMRTWTSTSLFGNVCSCLFFLFFPPSLPSFQPVQSQRSKTGQRVAATSDPDHGSPPPGPWLAAHHSFTLNLQKEERERDLNRGREREKENEFTLVDTVCLKTVDYDTQV